MLKRCLSVAACGCALDNLRPDTKTYTYDALGRLLAVNASVSPDKSYDYSADGNLELKDNNTQFYGENFDAKHGLTSINDGTDFAYDDNGNMTSMVKSGVTTGYVYDPENRLTKVTQNSVTLADYTYDDFGERVSKKVSGQRTDYYYPFYEKSAQKEDQYVIFDGVRVAKVSGGGAVTYFHTDHLGSHHVTTNSSGTQTVLTNYLPFGEFEGTPPTGTEGPNYTGQHYDSETGLYYYGARYYNPKIGRFLNADWIVQSPFNSQSYNRFSYVGNNPVNFVDPSGNQSAVDLDPIIVSSDQYESVDLSPITIFPNLDTRPSNYYEGILGRHATLLTDAQMSGISFNFSRPLVQDIGELIKPDVIQAVLSAQSAIIFATNVYTTVESGIGLYQFGKAAVIGLSAGSIRSVNSIFSIAGRELNCVNCVIATDAVLAGRPASALTSFKPQRISIIEEFYGQTFRNISSAKEIEALLIKEGLNSRGIVFGINHGDDFGHVFNAVNQKGVVRFLDGQTGTQANTNFSILKFLKTSK